MRKERRLISVDVRLKYWLDLEVSFEEGTTLRIGDDEAVLFEEDPEEVDEGEDPRDACLIRIRRWVEPEIAAAFELVADRRLPEGSDLSHPTVRRGLERGRADGRLWLPIPFRALPQGVQDELTRLRNELDNTREAFGRAIRWRLGSRGGLRTLIGAGYREWSIGGGPWRQMPQGGGDPVRFHARIFPVLAENARADIEAMTRSEAPSEPVAHAILREAHENRGRHPRSSLILCVVALEVGTKDFISRVAPIASWLATEVPTPPIAKMIANYLPALTGTAVRKLKRPPRAVLKLIGDGAEARNTVAHRGALGWSTQEHNELLAVTRAFLYAVDYVTGSDWAFDLLSDAERQAWLTSDPTPNGAGSPLRTGPF